MLYEVITSLPQILWCALLGVTCGLVAYLFLRMLHLAEAKFSAARIPVWLRAAAGGCATGLIAIRFVITSYSIHYTKLYDGGPPEAG